MKLHLVLFIFAALVILSGCESLKAVIRDPVVSVDSVAITEITFEKADLLVTVVVENPNSFPIPFPLIDWELDINDYNFAEGKIEQNETIGMRKSVTVEIPVSITYTELYNAVKSVAEQKEIDYTVNIGLRFPVPVLENRRFNVEIGGTLPLPVIPKISFRGFELKTLGLQKIEYLLTLEIENNNTFDITIGDFFYDFAVNGLEWSQGTVSNPPVITAGNTAEIPLSLSLNSLSIIRDITQIIAGRKNVEYLFAGAITLNVDLPLFREARIPYSFSGTIQLR
ncbi:MAG: LEA type 2 family protein [Spirochaetaceae bacterium]|nr:LEA type 2 family protein [Spirochaetaceae bacterium]